MTLDVSVVIPTYNQNPRYLTEAIESALNQSYPRERFEVLVVDDGSAIIPPDVVTSEFKRESVRLVKKSHGGTAHALNAGIRSMRGKYFKWLSSDDALCLDALEILMSKANLECVVYGDWVRMDQNSCVLNTHAEPVFSGAAEMKRFLWRSFFANGSAALIPRSAFARVGMFDESLPYFEDYDWWLRSIFLYDYSFVHVNGIVAKYRTHLGQLTTSIGEKSLVEWHIKKRLYSACRGTSNLDIISNPSISSLIKLMSFQDVSRLYRQLFRNSPPPSGLKKLKYALLAM